MYIPLYLIQHRHMTHLKKENKKYTHEKSLSQSGTGNSNAELVRLLLQNRRLPARLDPRAKSAAEK